MDYNVKLTREQREKIARRLVDEINFYDTAALPRRTLAIDWRRDVDMFPDDTQPPWENASDVRSPLTAIAVDQHALRLNQAITETSPPFTAVPEIPAAIDMTSKAEQCLAAFMEHANWKHAARLLHKELPVVCPAAIRLTWKKEVRWVPEHQIDRDEALYQTLTGQVDEVTAIASSTKFKNGEPDVVFGHQEKVVKEGLDFKAIQFEDLVLFPPTAKTVEDCYGVGERMNLRGFDLKSGADDGTFDKEAVLKILQGQSDQVNFEALAAQELDAVFVSMMGSPEFSDNLHKTFEAHQICWYGDIEENGRPTWYYFGLHKSTGQLYQAQYLPYEHGESCYTVFPYMERIDTMWGRSVAQHNATLQQASSKVLCDFLNLTDLMLCYAGSLLIRRGSGINAKKFKWRPGTPIEVDDLNSVKPLEVPQSIPQALQHMLNAFNQLKVISDLLNSTSNVSSGRETDTQKTATELSLVLSNQGQLFTDKAVPVGMRWQRVFNQAAGLIAQYASDNTGMVTYRVGEGQSQFMQVPKEILEDGVKFVPAVVKQFIDPNVAVNQAMMMNKMTLENPLFSVASPPGGVPPDWDSVGEAFKDLLRRMRPPNFDSWIATVDTRVEFLKQFSQNQNALMAATAARQQDFADQTQQVAADQQQADLNQSAMPQPPNAEAQMTQHETL